MRYLKTISSSQRWWQLKSGFQASYVFYNQSQHTVRSWLNKPIIATGKYTARENACVQDTIAFGFALTVRESGAMFYSQLYLNGHLCKTETWFQFLPFFGHFAVTILSIRRTPL